MRAVIYHRPEKGPLSEEDGGLIKELESFSKSRGYELTNNYIDGTEEDKRKRPAFIQMMKDANKHKFDAVFVYSFRNFRKAQGMKDVKYILHLKNLGIRFVSYKEQFFDTSSGYAPILSSMLEWISEEETKNISERTKAGLEKAKSQGIIVGRPKLAVDIDQILSFRAKGCTLSEISKNVGVSKETVRRILKSNIGKDQDVEK